MSDQIFAFVTCTRVRWEGEDSDPVEECGWVDVSWSPRQLEESRNYVRPFMSVKSDAETLQYEVECVLDWLDGGYEDNGDGTFYSRDSYQPHDEPWSYTYAVHFIRKYFGDKGWTESAWHPKCDGGLDI